MPKPFLVFPWNRPFLPSLKALLDRVSARPGGAVPLIVSPTSRPWQYLKALYRREAEQAAGRRKASLTRLLPRVVTLNELVQAWHADATGSAARQASFLDEVAVLYGAVKAAGASADAYPFDGSEAHPRQHLWDLDLAHFFPWGVKLARLVAELLENGIAPSDMAGLEGDVNADGLVDVIDLNLMIEYLLGNNPAGFNTSLADLDHSSTVNANDMNRLINIILGN